MTTLVHIEPSHFYHTIDWEARAAQMLTALYGHDQAYRGNLKHFYSEKDGNVTPKDAFEREDSYRDPVFPQDSNCLSHIGIISSAQEYLFCVLQTSEDKNESPVAFVDGPYQIYERLENRNWRAGESYCSEWDEEGIARLLAYWSL